MDKEQELREMAKFYRQLAQMYQQTALDYNCRAEELLSMARCLASVAADPNSVSGIDAQITNEPNPLCKVSDTLAVRAGSMKPTD